MLCYFQITQEQTPKRAGMLMKSNSLSHEPWRIYAMDKECKLFYKIKTFKKSRKKHTILKATLKVHSNFIGINTNDHYRDPCKTIFFLVVKLCIKT